MVYTNPTLECFYSSVFPTLQSVASRSLFKHNGTFCNETSTACMFFLALLTTSTVLAMLNTTDTPYVICNI